MLPGGSISGEVGPDLSARQDRVPRVRLARSPCAHRRLLHFPVSGRRGHGDHFASTTDGYIETTSSNVSHALIHKAVRLGSTTKLARMGGFVNNEALGDESSGFQLGRALCDLRQEFPTQRWVRVALEAIYDSMSWVCGLLIAISLTGDMEGARPAAFTMARLILAVILLSLGSGLLAGLYRGRYQRGSFDEVMGSTMATCAMVLFLALLSPMLVGGQRAILPTLAGSALFALSAMLGARYVAVRPAPAVQNPGGRHREHHRLRRRRGRLRCLIRRLHREPNAAYRPVAVLDDNPDKRRLRIQGIPVRGNRSRMGEVAAMHRSAGACDRDRRGKRHSYP